ncbi:MAG: transglutaminase domain-containing protein [FCB group bacterium]|nr:transglutaminase domain-containing protein [FCB group bacterium]
MQKLFIVAILFFLVSCCSLNLQGEAAVNYKKAGENRHELYKAVRYFQKKGDPQQIEALYFLLENMDEHSYVEYAVYDSNDVEFEFNVLDYPDYDSMVEYMETVEKEIGELHYTRKTHLPDLETITAHILIENIEQSFEVWRTQKWAQDISFETFCELILPYRGSNEPLESFRLWFREYYSDLPGKLENASDPIEAAGYINTELIKWFTFDPRFYWHPTDQGLTEMRENGLGRCEDMTNLAIYAMRANGLPVTSDYTPYWADTGNNHAWNAILSEDGMAIPFMGCEANPGHYNLRPKMAKAYRKTFSRQKDNLVFKLEDWEDAPPWLSGKYYTDVTEQYTDAINVRVKLARTIPDSTNYAYLCVFNSGDWKAIHWGKISDNQVVFTNMGKDIMYLPMFYVHEELIPAGNPFILHSSNEAEIITGSESTVDLRLVSTTKVTVEDATEGKDIVHLTEGNEYELFYWHDGWQSAGGITSGKDPIQFQDVPANRLYWLVEKESRREERIFTWDKNQQVWW